MTWTTAALEAVSVHVWLSLVVLAVVALAYGLGLLFEVAKRRRLGEALARLEDGYEEDLEP